MLKHSPSNYNFDVGDTKKLLYVQCPSKTIMVFAVESCHINLSLQNGASLIDEPIGSPPVCP